MDIPVHKDESLKTSALPLYLLHNTATLLHLHMQISPHIFNKLPYNGRNPVTLNFSKKKFQYTSHRG